MSRDLVIRGKHLTEDGTLRKAVARVRGEASAARAFFHTWKALEMAREDAGLLATINDDRYSDFFLASIAGNFRLFFVSLGNIMDEDQRSIGISKVQNTLKKCGKGNLAIKIDEVIHNYQGVINNIRYIRNKSIAHSDFEEADEIFEKFPVTPNQIQSLIDEILDVLNAIASELNFPDSISEGKRNEQATQNILEALRINRIYQIQALRWTDARGFFEEHGCVISGKPEIEWYNVAWVALEKAELTCSGKLGSFQVNLATVKLRALCLMAMYLGVYRAAGEFSNLGEYVSELRPISWYLQLLNVDMDDIWNLAHQQGGLNTGRLSCWEDEDTDLEQLYEVAVDLVVNERDVIYEALVEHYGGSKGLFVSWWNSRLPVNEGGSWQSIFASAVAGDGTLEAWHYVRNGMRDFFWN